MLHEIACAAACDLVVTDAKVAEEELRLLEILARSLSVDRPSAAAIERDA